MFVSLLLKSARTCDATAPTVIVREALVSVEEVDVGVRGQLGVVTSCPGDPNQNLCRGQVKSDRCDRLVRPVPRFHSRPLI
jgi:hypothetical protein